MAVFLINQCTFSKLPNLSNDQSQSQQNIPATSNGSTSQQQVPNPGLNTNGVIGGGGGISNGLGGGVVGANSNICGLKFESLMELIHHIEDNHITDVIDYPTQLASPIPGMSPQPAGVVSPYYNGQAQQQQQQQQHLPPQHHGQVMQTQAQQHHPQHPHPHMIAGPPQPPIQQPIYSANNPNHHTNSIIQGGWLPTSCILRIFNSTQKHKPPPPTNQQAYQQQQQIQQQQFCGFPQGVVMQQQQQHPQQPIQTQPIQQQPIQPQPIQQQPIQQQPIQPQPIQQQPIQPQPIQPQPIQQQPIQQQPIQHQPIQPQPIQPQPIQHQPIQQQPIQQQPIQQQQFCEFPQGVVMPQQQQHPQQHMVSVQQVPSPMQPQTPQAPQTPQTPQPMTGVDMQGNAQVCPPATSKPVQLLKCPECKRTYKTPHGLKNHRERNHGLVKE